MAAIDLAKTVLKSNLVTQSFVGVSHGALDYINGEVDPLKPTRTLALPTVDFVAGGVAGVASSKLLERACASSQNPRMRLTCRAVKLAISSWVNFQAAEIAKKDLTQGSEGSRKK